MRGSSHRHLGSYLARHYMAALPRRYAAAFRFGCIQPDRNPATYLKGSLRHRWLRGHNWGNSQRFMARIAARLEKRKRLYLPDYYTLGKLIHYIADSFTAAHNESFGTCLTAHREYERALQRYFQAYLSSRNPAAQDAPGSLPDYIRACHSDYIRLPRSLHTDSRYTHRVCTAIMSRLTAR